MNLCTRKYKHKRGSKNTTREKIINFLKLFSGILKEDNIRKEEKKKQRDNISKTIIIPGDGIHFVLKNILL